MKKLIRVVVAISIILSWTTSLQATSVTNRMITYADFEHVHHIAVSMSHVYFATSSGITRFNKLEDRWEQPLTSAVGLDDREIIRIWVDTFDEKLFVQTNTGLFRYDLLFEQWYPVDEIPIIENSSRHIRAPAIMFPPASFTYDPEGRLFDEFGRQFIFSDVVDDGSGTLWMGLWGYGAARAGSAVNSIELLPYGLLQNRVNALAFDGQELFMSGAIFDGVRAGISIFDIDQNSFSFIESGLISEFPAYDINCLEISDSLLYAGTENGVLILDKSSGAVLESITKRSGLSDNIVLSLLPLNDSLLIGTASGLNLLTPGDSVAWIYSGNLGNETVYDLIQVDSAIWVATSGGAYRLRIGEGTIQRFQDRDLFTLGRIYGIEQVGQSLWFATDDGLLQLDLATGATFPHRLTNPSRSFRALAVNDKIAAASTFRGLTIIFYDRKKPISREFGLEDGLPSQRVYSLLIEGDYLWIGTDRGLTRFLWNDPYRVD